MFGNVSVSVWGAVEWLLYAIIVGFIWRSTSAYLADKDIGKAMSYVLG